MSRSPARGHCTRAGRKKTMEILNRGIMPKASKRLKHDTDITLESWPYGFCVACFPVASEGLNFAVQRHRTFRLAFWFDSIDDATKCYNNLRTGLEKPNAYRSNAEHPDYIDYILHD